MNNTTRVIIAAAAGAAAGVLLGILFAPAKGRETRDSLLNKGKELAEDVSKKFKAMAGSCKETEEALN
jgi:gas vesicle protein